MNKFNLQVTLSNDANTGKILAVYFRIRKGQIAETVELEDGRANADYDRKGNLLGIELLAPCKLKVLNKLSEKEPANVREFFKSSSPRGMVLC